LVSACIALAQTDGDLIPWADHAVLEIETVNAGRGHQLLGTYSRYQWAHPNPAYFYADVPLYELAGKSPAALNAMAAIINLIAAAGIVLLTWRRAGPAAGVLAALACGLWLAQMGPVFLRDFWVPYIVALPFAFYIFLAAAFASGSLALLPAAVVVGSFVGGTNLSCAPVVGVLFVAALVIHLAVNQPWREPRAQLRGALIPVLVSLVAVAVIWWPTVHEQLTGNPGNLTVIRNFFKVPDPGHTWHEAWTIVANSLATLVRGPIGGDLALPGRSGAAAIAIGMIVLSAAGAVVGWARRRTFAAALCTLALTGIAGEFYAATNIRGDLFVYLIQWFAPIAIATVVGSAAALAPELEPLAARLPRAAPATAIAAAALALAVLNVVKLGEHASLAHDAEYANTSASTLWPAVDRWVRRAGIRDPLIAIPANDQWPYAAVVVDQRVRRSLPTAVDPGYLFMFGRQLAPAGGEDATLYFLPPGASPPAGAKLAVSTATTQVYSARNDTGRGS
jgi:hypothetical protein